MPSSLKNQVIKSIESADEKLLRMIQALISGYHSDDSAIPDWFYQELHKDRMNYLSEQDGAEDWESVKRKLKRKY